MILFVGAGVNLLIVCCHHDLPAHFLKVQVHFHKLLVSEAVVAVVSVGWEEPLLLRATFLVISCVLGVLISFFDLLFARMPRIKMVVVVLKFVNGLRVGHCWLSLLVLAEGDGRVVIVQVEG